MSDRFEYKPLRPFYDDEPTGYMESPQDYVLNNVWLAEKLLDLYGQGKISKDLLNEME